MAPILYCVRHAQAEHNVVPHDENQLDPPLTALGRSQALELQKSFSAHERLSAVFASPLSRTTNSAVIAFKPALGRNNCLPKIIALADAQETSDYPNDMGLDLDLLKKRCEENDWPVDLSRVPKNWNDKSLNSRYAPSATAIRKRARDARRTIRDEIRKMQEDSRMERDPEVVLVSHGGFLHYFTEDWEDSAARAAWKTGRLSDLEWDLPGTSWANMECRAYTFASLKDEEDPNASIHETANSRTKRGKQTPQPPKEDQEKMFAETVAFWRAQGNQDPTQWENDVGNQDDSEKPAPQTMSGDDRRDNVKVAA